ncbi:MAG: hypothetical protein QY317_16110 [Candidatus Jettenia caeni]|nr:MAG: hypothetical protein QY317_16110 [Candidatus Jettenia caeni]
MATKKDIDGVTLLRQFKDRYGLTWKQVADSLGISESWIGNWYTSKKQIPRQYFKLIQIFLDNPIVFEKYKFHNK